MPLAPLHPPRIEEELGDQARFAGHNFRNPSAIWAQQVVCNTSSVLIMLKIHVSDTDIVVK